jgi:Dioxygenase
MCIPLPPPTAKITHSPNPLLLQISHPAFKPVTTQIFPADDPYLSTDTVFAVKNDLVVEFKPRKGEPGEGGLNDSATLDLEYNIILAEASG